MLIIFVYYRHECIDNLNYNLHFSCYRIMPTLLLLDVIRGSTADSDGLDAVFVFNVLLVFVL